LGQRTRTSQPHFETDVSSIKLTDANALSSICPATASDTSGSTRLLPLSFEQQALRALSRASAYAMCRRTKASDRVSAFPWRSLTHLFSPAGERLLPRLLPRLLGGAAARLGSAHPSATASARRLSARQADRPHCGRRASPQAPFAEALGHTGVPFAGLRPDHRAGVELTTTDARRAAEAAADLEGRLDNGVTGEARRDRFGK